MSDEFGPPEPVEGFGAPEPVAKSRKLRAPQQVSAWQAALKGVQDLPTFGFGDELGGALQAGLGSLTGADGSFGERYRQARDENRAESAAARQQHAGAYYGAGIGASLPTLALTGIGVAPEAALLTKTIAGGVSGIGQGALAGLGSSEADTAGGMAQDALTGGLVGGLLGSAAPTVLAPVAAPLRWLGSKAKDMGSALIRGATPSAAARELSTLGVNGLSAGQANPGLASMEEAAMHTPALQGPIGAAREAGRTSWQNAVLRRGLAPGEQQAGGSVADKLASAYEGFEKAYAPIKATPIRTAGPGQQSIGDQMRQGFAAAADDPGVYATDADRAAAAKWLNNAATKAQYSPGQAPTAEPLLAVRSSIRQAAFKRLKAGDEAGAELLRKAEDHVTDLLHQNLSPDAAKQLAATDAAYAQHQIVSDAVARGGDQVSGFTPAQLSASLKGAMKPGQYARGDGGELRDLSRLGREVLDAKTTPTGLRGTIETLPGAKYVTGPAMALANMPTGRMLVAGQTAPQRALAGLFDRMAPQIAPFAAAAERAPGASSLTRQALLAQLLRGYASEAP